MINSFSSQQISETGNLDSNLISRQYKLNLIQDENPKLKQSQKANQLRYSTSILQRYRSNIYMLSPHRNQPNITNTRSKNVSNTIFDNNSHPDTDVKRPRLTSNDLKTFSKNPLLKLNLLKEKKTN